MARDDDLHDLTRHPIFAVLESEALRFIALSAGQRILRSGEVLFRRDEPSDGGYFLRSGSVALEPAWAQPMALRASWTCRHDGEWLKRCCRECSLKVSPFAASVCAGNVTAELLPAMRGVTASVSNCRRRSRGHRLG